MSILTGVNVGKSFGAFDVFTDLHFSLARGDKVALVGPNGCGKTTLLRIVAGVDEPNTGGYVRFARGVTWGYLAQTAEASNEHTVWQHAQAAFTELNTLQARMAQIERALAEPGATASLLERYGELQHEFELRGGYESEAKIKRVLGGLGFDESDWHAPLAQLSGGQRMRAALAQLLLQSPDALLLDEPTNHLDQQGVAWLESFLQEWEGTLIAVSHDRYFLDEVCNQVWELAKGADGRARLEFYRGGYTEYVQQWAARRERARQEFEAQQAFIKKQEEYIRRNIAGQNTAQAKGRLRRLNRLERLERPIEQRAMVLRLKDGPRSGDRVLETAALEVGYSQHSDAATGASLFAVPDLLLWRGERAALIGPNGTGKTTFLKTILGEVPPLAGRVKIGAGVRIGYFAQAHEGLDPDKTVLQEVMSARPDLKLGEARDILGRFLFSGDDHFKRVGMLSGGERGRVALAKLTLQGANFLLLDEPTNHLDIPSQEILTEALQRFDGTLLLVSHDRYLVAALATQLWILERSAAGTTMTVFAGSYDAWLEQQDEAGARTEAKSGRHGDGHGPAEPSRAGQSRAGQSRAGQSRAGQSRTVSAAVAAPSKNAQQRRLAQLEAVEQRIEALERALHELSQQMESAGSDYARVQALSEAYAQTERALAEAWAEFAALA